MASTLQLGRALQRAARWGLRAGALRSAEVPGARPQRAAAVAPWWHRGLVTGARPLLATHVDEIGSRPQARSDVGNSQALTQPDEIDELVGTPGADLDALGPAAAAQPLDEPERALSVPYEELKALLAARVVWLVDVREPYELKEYGTIEGSINVPLGEVKEALNLSPHEFRARYGAELASPDAPNTVFLCRAGKRSHEALIIAQKIGYTKARHYGGGWLDWERREQQA